MDHKYSSAEFEAEFTYTGNDLGAVYAPDSSRFRLWAPTADAAWVNLYAAGDPKAKDLLRRIPMSRAEQGTWILEVPGDLNGIYYTYQVAFGKKTVEACDPYARATGVNGHRAMVLDLNSTNPSGWERDKNPNSQLAPTDCVLYELHIRDLSMDAGSGIRNKGKFLGLTETGTKNSAGDPTGLDHIKSLGITHLHLLPIFDFGSVDEAMNLAHQYNWGYDPVNFNVPEGSYSTDPHHGEVRVKELKQMIKVLHDNGISVVMDVVYNHVYKTEQFCFNKLVPQYFSRITDGALSNGSGCGNDTASERSMVSKYIVDSVCYWAKEYHIDGFRFDLAGLLDVDTINAVISAVHKVRPDVIFYGEGWDLSTLTTRPCRLTTQVNSSLTPKFAYFNDTIRDALRGSNFDVRSPGFVTGATGICENLESCFQGLPHWCSSPSQCVNYISCHDNHTIYDRISLTVPGCDGATVARLNRLAAAFSILSQGIPFLHAGEEMLRSKVDGTGNIIENSYNAPDRVNSLKWNNLSKPEQQKTLAYYQGLIAFRKAHPALRMRTSYDVLSHLVPVECSHPQIGMFRIRTDGLKDPAEEILLIFSAAENYERVPLPPGQWNLCIANDLAGTETLKKMRDHVTVPPLSAVVLTK